MSDMVSIEIQIIMPKTPKSFKTTGGKNIAIQNLSDDVLQRIGEKYIASLLSTAQEKRNKKTKGQI